MTLKTDGVSLAGHPVLGALELSLCPAETLAITGPSGVGKTTLLRLIAGLIPTQGAHVDGPIAMVFQEPRLLPWRNALRNITLTTGVDDTRAYDMLAQVGLAHKARHFPKQLSLGQQRRLALARAFAVRPKVMLMDEPFVSLDVETAAQMRDLFLRMKGNSDLSTVLVSHDPADIEALADRKLELKGAPAQFV